MDRDVRNSPDGARNRPVITSDLDRPRGDPHRLAILVDKAEFCIDDLVGACRLAEVLQCIVPVVGVKSLRPTLADRIFRRQSNNLARAAVEKCAVPSAVSDVNSDGSVHCQGLKPTFKFAPSCLRAPARRTLALQLLVDL